MRNRSQKGFTLIELLIVIAIIGILAAVLIPNLLNARARAYDAGANNCANSLQTSQEIYWIDNDLYTATLADLEDELATACRGVEAADTIVTDLAVAAVNGAAAQTYTACVYDDRGRTAYTVTPTSIVGDEPTGSDGCGG